MYIPLRCHSHHSLLTGVSSPQRLAQRCRELGLPGMALTDLNSLAGTTDFLALQNESHSGSEQPGNKLWPIIGAELNQSGLPGRLVALVRTREGYHNLCQLISARHLGATPQEIREQAPTYEVQSDEAQRGTAQPELHSATTKPKRASNSKFDGAKLDRFEFDLVDRAIEHSEGLIYLVDHPELLMRLAGRIDRRWLLAALPNPSAHPSFRISSTQTARESDGTRNTHLRQEQEQRPKQPNTTATDSGEPGGIAAANDIDASNKAPHPAQFAPEQINQLMEAALAVDVACVAAPDVYCTGPLGYSDHQLRAAIKNNALHNDLPTDWLANEPCHLLSAREACSAYAHLPDVPGPWPVNRRSAPHPDSALCGPFQSALEDPGASPLVTRSLLIAAACQYTPELGQIHFPEVQLEGQESPYSRLCDLAFHGAQTRYSPLRPEVIRRLEHELASIDQLGFSAYFLLVRQIADFAREQAIPFVGRGSAAASLVSYCLELTDADPLRYKLPFERFLNPLRTDMPDIDLDFCWRRRDEILEFVYRSFGSERTAMISTLCCFGLRSAFRETALAFGIPPAEINTISRYLPWGLPSAQAEIPFSGSADSQEPIAQAAPAQKPVTNSATSPDNKFGLPHALADNPVALAIASTPECRDFPFEDPRWQQVLQAANNLIDTPRNLGLHPGGIVVSPGLITDFASCQRSPKGVVTTQFDKHGVQDIGLVKMDLLGNRALTVIDDCVRSLSQIGIELDPMEIPENDPATANTLREARTLGCFQVESPGMRNLLKQTGASDMDAVIQAVALIRPGPASSGMKDAYVRRFRGCEEPIPPHPKLTELLNETQGIMLYQEDVMRAAAELAGLTLSEADLLRRALQKRNEADLERFRQLFFAGCERQGLNNAETQPLWDLASNFAAFAFCKAHAVTYGRIAYRTVYLKTHYPAAYLCAFLASETGYYRSRVYVEEARRLGVAVLPPDINKSGATFQLEWYGQRAQSASRDNLRDPSSTPTGALRIGLSQIKGISAQRVESLLVARTDDGPFFSLPDFLERTGARHNETEAMIQAGAFDCLDRTRPELLWRLHLLKRDPVKPPQGQGLDMRQLLACHETPGSRTSKTVARADNQARGAKQKPNPNTQLGSPQQSSGGWGERGLGMAQSRLQPGESARLFPEPEAPGLVLPGLPDTSLLERGQLEQDLMGLTVCAHPTRLFPCEGEKRAAQKAPPLVDCAAIERFANGRISLRGWLAASRPVRTQRGETMRFLTLEDESGIAEVVLFPDTYRRDGHHLKGFGPFLISGVAEDQMGSVTLHAEHIW